MLEIAYEKCVAALRRGKQVCIYILFGLTR